jgi:hypothetical protein
LDAKSDCNTSVHPVGGYQTIRPQAGGGINVHVDINIQRSAVVALRPNNGIEVNQVSLFVVLLKWSRKFSQDAACSLPSGEGVIDLFYFQSSVYCNKTRKEKKKEEISSIEVGK